MICWTLWMPGPLRYPRGDSGPRILCCLPTPPLPLWPPLPRPIRSSRPCQNRTPWFLLSSLNPVDGQDEGQNEGVPSWGPQVGKEGILRNLPSLHKEVDEWDHTVSFQNWNGGFASVSSTPFHVMLPTSRTPFASCPSLRTNFPSVSCGSPFPRGSSLLVMPCHVHQK